MGNEEIHPNVVDNSDLGSESIAAPGSVALGDWAICTQERWCLREEVRLSEFGFVFYLSDTYHHQPAIYIHFTFGTMNYINDSTYCVSVIIRFSYKK